MFKNMKGKLILSTILTLLPVWAGFLLWNKLPDTMVSHWGIDGTPDGYSAKIVMITAPYILMAVVNWICVIFSDKLSKGKELNQKAISVVLWIMPIISIFMAGMIYSQALGMKLDPKLFVMPLCGFIFMMIGNYLPKCSQNVTMGIKLPWTLKNEENWYATHRFGGKVWMLGGFLIMCAMFLPTPFSLIIFLVGIFALVLIPVAYSYLYYQKQQREGTWVLNGIEYEEEAVKLAHKISRIALIPVLTFILMIMFTGNINYQYEEESFTIEADFWSDVTVKYENIKSITYREDLDSGYRASGFGSARLGMGTYNNDEFGNYTRFCYQGCDAHVVLEVGDKMLVINGKDEAATLAIYEALEAKLK